MTDEGYNGWANRETWAFCLWYGNDQGMYEQAKEYATDYATERLDTNPDGTPWDDVDTYRMGERFLEQTWAEWDEYLLHGKPSQDFLTMLEDIGSRWRVDKSEVGAWLRELVEDES